MSETVQYLPHNQDGRDLLVGDLHGCVSLLEHELARIDFDPNRDRVIAVGDLIDRGPESADIGYLLFKPWFYSVLGNHDLSFAARVMDAVDWGEWEMPYAHPWATSLDEDHVDHLRRLIARLPWTIEIDTEAGLVGVVHAEVPRSFQDWQTFTRELDSTSSSQIRQQALTGRELHRLADPVDAPYSDPSQSESCRFERAWLHGVAHVVHGHSPAFDRRIHQFGNRFWIDCGGWEFASRPDLAVTAEYPPRLAVVDARWPGVLL